MHLPCICLPWFHPSSFCTPPRVKSVVFLSAETGVTLSITGVAQNKTIRQPVNREFDFTNVNEDQRNSAGHVPALAVQLSPPMLYILFPRPNTANGYS